MPRTAVKTDTRLRGARAMTGAVLPDASDAGSARETVAWDDSVPGLGLRKRGAGRRWIFQTCIDGRTVKRTLGSSAVLTLDDARAAARQLARELDGAAPKTDAFAPAPRPPADTTVARFASRWLTDCAQRWKPSTRLRHAGDVERHILPALGDLSMRALDRRQVVAWRETLSIAAGSRNRVLAVLSGMMRHAEIVGVRDPDTNPCRGLRRRKSDFEAQYLTAPKYRRLGRALLRWEKRDPEIVALIRFVALTGWRRSWSRTVSGMPATRHMMVWLSSRL